MMNWEVILKYCEEICGKVMDFTDLAARVRYEMEWDFSLMFSQTLFMSSLSRKFSNAANLFVTSV